MMKKRIITLTLVFILCLPLITSTVNANGNSDSPVVVTNFEGFMDAFNTSNLITIGGSIEVPDGTVLNFMGKTIIRYNNFMGDLFVLMPGDSFISFLFLNYNGGNEFGGRLITSYHSNAVISGLNIQFYNTIGNGGIIYVANGIAEIERSTFFNNVNTDGAIVAISSTATAIIYDCNFLNNVGTIGGAIHNNGNLTIRNTSFNTNASQTKGGAIVNSGFILIDDVSFQHDAARDEASTIYNTGIVQGLPLYGFYYDKNSNRFSSSNMQPATSISSIVYIAGISAYYNALENIPLPLRPPQPTPPPSCTYEYCNCKEHCELENCTCDVPQPTPTPPPTCDYEYCECGEYCDYEDCICDYVPQPTPPPSPEPTPNPKPEETPTPSPSPSPTPELPPSQTSSPSPTPPPLPTPQPPTYIPSIPIPLPHRPRTVRVPPTTSN